ncbi:methionyl-tRNA formyltransferase [candidate division WOR-1 bacterium RIFCSPHIGHO2_01_FULL_53_15]|uniref:Methionyl-tRNA formyltransferase n=1 Tax=candidate division WOR-1 bacterium RIFCSPHIGHO2_01_FULL_53_15 TaxID=1802564 RepID=A0A1F4Q0Z2_UNCSA|nr:MAG: methionyl-tRNA formyltransferase [candidate division WOR-1 bacterium RIFCSPHIGHO2_01_FULL_53_15]OGC10763.1 MAG: methionyl-tRNA formyltransferase [candidate division WOR-1 bacterium RIFCSPHIGHO2_02_FULL_53_26]
MRIVFFGTPEPAAQVLTTLIDAKQEIAGVVTQPDRPAGRGQRIVFSAVKEVALKAALPLEQPESVKNNNAFKAWLESVKADLCVVVAYGKILPKDILEIPKHGFINIHASLLPKYRGAAPIQWALLKGEKESGATIFKLVEQLDAGPIAARKEVEITEDDNYETLSRKIFAAACPLLIKVLHEIKTGKVEYVPQNEAGVTLAPSFAKESGEIDWRKTAVEIHDRIRALIVWPTAHTFFRGKRLKIFRARPVPLDISTREKQPGEIIEIIKHEGLLVATGRGNLLLLELQLEGKKRMKAADFVIGHDVKPGETLPD